jgi:hypothetical protein
MRPNPFTALDTAMTVLRHADSQWRGAGEFFRSAA